MPQSSTGASAAAGPLTVTCEPPSSGNSRPATIAEISPAIAGAPEASATPSENGVHSIATCRPAPRSWRQWRRPARPLAGTSSTGL